MCGEKNINDLNTLLGMILTIYSTKVTKTSNANTDSYIVVKKLSSCQTNQKQKLSSFNGKNSVLPSNQRHNE